MQFQLNFKSGKPVPAAGRPGEGRRGVGRCAGESRPSIRPLAELLRVNRNTVAKAYTELENQRVIETVAGKGCFISATGSPFKKDVRLKLVAEEMDGAVVQAHHLQIAKADFLKLAEDRFDAFQHKRSRAETAGHP